MVAIEVGMNEFLTIFIMTFALFLFIVGVFTAYFGSGKSRKIGVGLLAGGIGLGILWMILTTELVLDEPIIEGIWLSKLVIHSIMVIAAAALGALVALGIFLVAIMKS